MTEENGKAGLSWAERKRLRVEGVEKVLPDGGLTVRIRAVEMSWFLMRANLEDFLTPLVTNLIDRVELRASQEDMKKREDALSPQELIAYEQEGLRLRAEYAKYAMISPRIVDDPQGEDEIALDDLSYINAIVIWNWATQPLEALASFRRGPAQDLDAVGAESGSAPKAKRARRPARVD